MMWDADYRERFTLACLGIVRTSITFFSGLLCITNYKILQFRYKGIDWDNDEYKAARKAVHARCAKRLLRICEINEGVYTKAGQHIASLTFILPKEYTDCLSKLQDRAPFRLYKEVTKVIKSEFGGQEPTDLFLEFEEKPIASASIAQVHRAISKNGEPLAVKIQHASVSRLFHTDLWTMKTLSSIVSALFPNFQLDWIVREFSHNMRKEFDFRNEGLNSEETGRRFAHRQREFKVPKVYWEYTTGRVLSMEYINGVKINDVEGIKAMGADPRHFGKLLQQIFAEMIFCHGIFHCDPHPGNAMVARNPQTKQPQLVLLDHGLYRELSTNFRLAYCHLWRSLLLNDPIGLEQACTDLGVSEFATILSLLLTGHLPNQRSSFFRRTGDKNASTAAQRAKIREHFENKPPLTLSDVVNFLEKLPREMLLIFRVTQMVNSVQRDLGGWRGETFVVNARYSTRGYWCETKEERNIRSGLPAHLPETLISLEEGDTEELLADEKSSLTVTESGMLISRPRPVPPIKRWYLPSGTPTLFRSFSYLNDAFIVKFKVAIAEIVLRFWEWWNSWGMPDPVLDSTLENRSHFREGKA